MTLGEKIRLHRRKRGISVKDLSKTLGVADMTVYNWEKDFTEPTFFYAVCLADIFGVTLNYLAGKEKLNDEIQDEIHTKQIS